MYVHFRKSNRKTVNNALAAMHCKFQYTQELSKILILILIFVTCDIRNKIITIDFSIVTMDELLLRFVINNATVMLLKEFFPNKFSY